MFDASGKKEERTSDPCPCRLPSTIDGVSWDQCLACVVTISFGPSATVLETVSESNHLAEVKQGQNLLGVIHRPSLSRESCMREEDFSSLKPIERVV